MYEQKYEVVNGKSTVDRVNIEERDDAFFQTQQKAALLCRQQLKFISALSLALAISLITNAILFSKTYHLQQKQQSDADVTFVGLPRNIDRKLLHDERSIDDAMWEDPRYSWWTGWVALDNDEMASKGYPTSMHWPWDESKSIYLLHAFHSLHCVYVIRDSLRQFRDGDEQLWPFEHVTHCLHVLHEDTTCNADDTPRYTGRLHDLENATNLFSGFGQTHKCRDWSKLRTYALEHSACYARPSDHYVSLIDRYKNCPDGSRPWEAVEARRNVKADVLSDHLPPSSQH